MSQNVQFEDEEMGGGISSPKLAREIYSSRGSSSPTVLFLKKIRIVRTERQAAVAISIVAFVVLTCSMILINHALAAPQIIELRVK